VTLRALAPPSSAHWLGTDAFGRDVLARLIYGSRTALLVGFGASVLGATLGSVLGVASAYFAGRVDLYLQRVMDVFLSFPLIILALALVAAILAVGLVAIAFNTIRLQILTQRDEIEVSKLIGATDSFIQRPFLYLGLLQGLSGVMIALALVWAGLALMNTEIAGLARTYGSDFQLPFFSTAEAIALALLAGGLGWAGAYMSVSKYLREIEPK